LRRCVAQSEKLFGKQEQTQTKTQTQTNETNMNEDILQTNLYALLLLLSRLAPSLATPNQTGKKQRK